MSTDEFQQIWKAYDAKLERSLQLNLRLLKDVQTQKAKSALKLFVAGSFFMVVFGVAWVLLLGFILYYVRSQPVMAVSFAVFIFCSAFAVGEYIRGIRVIHGISYAENIVDTQEKLAGLQSSMIRSLRIAWLQLPFWSTFFISNAMIRDGGSRFWIIQTPITLGLTIAAIFLYRNITVENAKKKKWVKALIRGSGARTVARAMDFMKEIEDFKGDC
jgi:hypothetical protein